MKPNQKKEILERKGILFPEKNRKALKGIALVGLLELRGKHKNWTLNQVLAEMVSGFNPDMPPQFLLEFTQHIINHWVAMEEKEKQAVAA